MATTNHYTANEWNLIDQMQRDTEAWLRSVRDGGAWDQLPNEANRSFFPIAMRASMGVQALLRGAIGAHYFTSVDAYKDWRTTYPVLVYSVSPVFGGKPRIDYAYDVHCARTLRSTTTGIDTVMSIALGLIEKRLMEAGELDIADFYSPRRAHDIVKAVRIRQPKMLLSLLRSDETVVMATVQLIAMAAQLRDAGTRRDADLKAAASAYVKTIHRKLRNFFQGLDLTAIAPELLAQTINSVRAAIESAAALAQEPGTPDPLDQAA